MNRAILLALVLAGFETEGRREISKPETSIEIKFPVGLAPSNPKSIIKDVTTGERLHSDVVLAGFIAGTPTRRIHKILSREGMKVIGTDSKLGVYQIRIRGNGTVAGVHAAIKALKTYKEVEYAEPNGVTQIE